MSDQLTHIDADGRIQMVDVGHKPVTERRAVARGRVEMAPATLALIAAGPLKKGDVLTTAELAGILAAKQTSQLIPLCHPLPLNQIEVRCTPNPAAGCVEIEATVRVSGKTGVEMEALTAVTVAALTVYDMAKAVDQTMRLTDIRLVEKTGGKRDFRAEEEA